MTKDELLKLMRMYVSISQEYVQEYPSNDLWKMSEVNKDYILCIKREGQLELLRELINLDGEE